MSAKISTRSRVIVAALAACGSVVACGSRNSEVGGETNWVKSCGDRTCPEPLSSDEVSTPPPAPAEPVFSDDLVTRAQQGTQAEREQRDLTGGALRVVEVPSLDTPEIITSPLGWLALSRGVQDGRTSQGLRTTLYRSQDGVHWQLHPLQESVDQDLELSSIAFGKGRYVLVGRDSDLVPVFWLSGDGQEWERQPQGVDISVMYGLVVYAENRFFAFAFRYVGVSENGVDWTRVPIDNVQPNSVAYGNGRYVMSGNGPLEVSEDGYTWRSIELSCDLPGACGTDPSGNLYQGVHGKVFFVNGKFYVDTLVSEDGETWTVGDAPAPIAWAGGRFFGYSNTGSLQSWTSGADVVDLSVVRPTEIAQTESGRRRPGYLDVRAMIPASVDAGWEDGLTCATALCLLLDDQLVLVPPVDQAPLPDHVPRDASGAPLLSDECPVSQMITCDDYQQRTNCVCNPDAPAGPEFCGDVGSYACSSAFSKVDMEWELSEIGEAGCHCDFVDPAEPPTYADTCSEGDSTCAAPLQCFSVNVNRSGGPPALAYFCTAACTTADDCPTWTATGYCAGEVQLDCIDNVCQRRACNVAATGCDAGDASCSDTP